ncbi:hypothetical protein GCM10020255_109000 [Rhodococcus baikonurensis]
MAHQIAVDIEPKPWTGRSDGTSAEHLRWHHAVQPYSAETAPGDCVLIGFSSDEGVRRNKGRRGAADGPDALRAGLASMALAEPLQIQDAGTVAVSGEELEAGQAALGNAVNAALDSGHFPVVLGEDTKSPTVHTSASRAPSCGPPEPNSESSTWTRTSIYVAIRSPAPARPFVRSPRTKPRPVPRISTA